MPSWLKFLKALPIAALPLLLSVAAFGRDYTSTEGFYKSIFVDGGYGLDQRVVFFAAESLGLSYECLATSSQQITRDKMVGTAADSNGALLYPDGAPRFRMMFTNGGKSNNHGSIMIGAGQKRISDFYHHGGSYTGSCAGAHLATLSTTVGGLGLNENYYHLWPARSHYTQLNYEDFTANFTRFKIPSNSPLWKYSDYGADSAVDSVFHNGGSYVIAGDDFYWYPGTEILATYAGPVIYGNENTGRDVVYQSMFGNGSIWAFKESDTTGRLVMSGSHPEGVMDGEQLRLTSGIVRYALDGQGLPAVKGQLQNGKARAMNDNAKPGFEKIGDMQYHHFTFPVTTSTGSLVLTLKGGAGYDFNLYAAPGAPAFGSTAPYQIKGLSGTKKILINHPAVGTWYVGVECVTPITTSLVEDDLKYVDAANILNGAPYEITASRSDSLAKNPTPAAILPAAANDTRFAPVWTAAGLTLRFYMPMASEYRLSLVDISGHVLWNRHAAEGSFPPGDQTVAVGAELPGGMLFAILESDAGLEMKKIAIRK